MQRSKDFLPYDIDGYLNRIKSIPNINEWVEFYIEEALQCYNANCMEAAVIMLGLSSEKILFEQIGALMSFLSKNYPVEYTQMQGELPIATQASQKYNLYIKYFDLIKNRVADQSFKDMKPLMDRIAIQSYANFTRITRNGLAHPSDTKMERIEVLMIFISFIKYCEIQYSFLNYFAAH